MIKDEIASLKIDREKEVVKESRSNKGMLWGVVIVLICVIVSAIAFWPSGGNSIPEVEVKIISTSGRSNGVQLLNAGGYIVARREATLSAKATGELVYLGVEGGDNVKKDQLLAKIKDDDIRAQLNREQANLQKAQNDYKRNKKLFDSGVISAAEFDAIETNLKLADANVTLSQAQLDATRVYAPFDGIVIKKYVDVGNMIVPGKDIISVIDTSEWYVEVDIGEDDISRIEIGQPAEVTTKVYPDRTFKAEVVAKMSKTKDNRGGGVVTVRVKLVALGQNNLQLSNVAARVAFLKSDVGSTVKDIIIVIPKKAVMDSNSKTKVFLVDNNIVTEREIKVGKTYSDSVEVLSGLYNGDCVIVSGLESVKVGSTVKKK